MKTGIVSTAYFHTKNPEAGLARMKRHGYSAMDYSFIDTETPIFSASDAEFDAIMQSHRGKIEGAGIAVYQTHGPWRYPPRDGTEADRQERFEKMSRVLHGTAMLGAKYMVIHPLMPFGVGKGQDEEALLRINIDFFRRLCAVAEREGVYICLENMPFPDFPLSTPAEILAAVKAIDHPAMRVCLDTGHCVVRGVDLGDAVRQIGREYLCALHVHDNDGRCDQHQLPYHGKANWDHFTAALKEIGYEGALSLECRIKDQMPEAIREHHEIGLAMIARTLAEKSEG